MLHAGPLVGEGVAVALEPAASAALDRLAALDDPGHAFLRAGWFAPGAGDRSLATLVARRPGGADAPLAALPLVERRVGPLTIREVAGAYWPWRSFPFAHGGGVEALAALLASPEGREALGRAWRLGPALADDPTVLALADAAPRAGWTLLTRRLGTCFIVDLAGLAAAGPWPSAKTLRKNRWLERRLAENGELGFRSVSGAQWSGEMFDLLARIEAESWVGREPGSTDTKFVDSRNRAVWTQAVRDPQLAEMLGASILEVGGVPAAFNFHLRVGRTLHLIANSFSERFREGSPGRILLYRDLQQAAAAGIETVGWGAGDPGYKSEMGARPGPDIVDLLVVRGSLAAALARPFWKGRRG